MVLNTYFWKAVYADGTELSQYNEAEFVKPPHARKGAKYTDIDRSKLKEFHIYKDSDPNNPFLVISLDGNKRLIYRRRVVQSLLTNKKEVVILAGYQEKIAGKNVQNINFIFEDGHIETVDKFRSDHKWYYPINFLPEEKLDKEEKDN